MRPMVMVIEWPPASTVDCHRIADSRILFYDGINALTRYLRIYS